MADDENKSEGTSRGNEWEVVSLSASTYDAVPGPKEFDSTDDNDKERNRTEEESSRAMFMSGHFVFPPSQHENLPLEPDFSEIHSESRGEDPDFTQERGLDLAGGDGPRKSVDVNWNIKGLSEVDEQHGIQFVDEKDIGGSTAFDESAIVPEDKDPTQINLDSPLDSLNSKDTTKEDNSVPPYEAWWKKRVASLYSQAKEASTLWSVVVAAALMGLVILGQRWQRERWQLQQLKWKIGMNDENMNRVLGPISRFKDVLVGGHRQSPGIRNGASADH